MTDTFCLMLPVCAGPAAAAGPGPSGVQGVAVSGPGHHLARRVDAAYFDSYSYFDIHHEMLSDKVMPGAGRGRV
jgi:hypothetical protein